MHCIHHPFRTFLTCLLAVALAPPAGADEFPSNAQTVLFLGDSITAAGGYIAAIETHLHCLGMKVPQFINLGLPSETCSGLSEPAHPFPRPDVHERLQRALDRVQPELVVACYGMNDAIYHPFAADRFAAYQRGIDRLIQAVDATGAKLVLLTPPPFDPLPLRQQGKLRAAGADGYAWFAPYENYDQVLSRYSTWLLSQREKVDRVVDVRAAIEQHVRAARAEDPDYTLAADGVHLDSRGHRLIASALLNTWALGPLRSDPAIHELVKKKTAILHDAWLTHVGHQRPGLPEGKSLSQASAEVAKLDRQIEQKAAAVAR